MSISSEITRIQNAKTDLKSSIEAKGVSVPAEAKIDAYSTLVDSISSGGGQEISGQEEITVKFGEDLNAGDAVCVNDMYTHESLIKMETPASIPPGAGSAIATDPKGLYVVHTTTTTPYMTIYKRTGDSFVKINNPSYMHPTTYIRGLAFSPDGCFFATTHSQAPFIIMYTYKDDVFTKIDEPTEMPSIYGMGVAFSPDSQYMITSGSSNPYIQIYKRNGDTFTKLSVPSVIPSAGTDKNIAFNKDGTLFTMSHSSSPYLSTYKIEGDTFTKISNPNILPTGQVRGIAYSPKSSHFAVAHTTEPYLTIYKYDGDVFTKLNDPTLPNGTGYSVAFSPDSNFLAVGSASSPYLLIYKRDGDTFTEVSDITNPPNSRPVDLSFMFHGIYLVGAYYLSPFTAMYKGGTLVGPEAFRSANELNEFVDAVGLGYAKESGLVGEEKKVIKIWG